MAENTNNNNNTRNANDVAAIVRMCEKMIAEAVARINDLSLADKQRVEELRLTDKERGEGLRLADIQRIDDMLKQQNDFNAAILKERDERLLQKFESLATAINKAETATENRFKGVNEFRATLADQQKTFLGASEYKSAHQNLLDLVNTSTKTTNDTIITQKERIDKIDNMKQGGQNIWILIVGIVGFIMGMTSFVLNLLGK